MASGATFAWGAAPGNVGAVDAFTLYHRTTIGEAREIMKRGFQDQKWGFGSEEEMAAGPQIKVMGVWLCDRVLGDAEGPPGDAVLEVNIEAPEQSLEAFQIADVLPDGRLWVVPAKLLNTRARVRILQVDPRTSWWFDRNDLEGLT